MRVCGEIRASLLDVDCVEKRGRAEEDFLCRWRRDTGWRGDSS